MKPISRNNKILLLLIAGLSLLIVVLVFLNTGDLALKRQLERDAQFIISQGERQDIISMDDILALDPVEFETDMDTSISDPRKVMLTGVELKDLLQARGFSLDGLSHIEVNGLDEYYSPLRIEEVADDGRVYVCIAMDGAALGHKSQGGYGPYMMVITGQRFAMRWCKFVEEIALI